MQLAFIVIALLTLIANVATKKYPNSLASTTAPSQTLTLETTTSTPITTPTTTLVVEVSSDYIYPNSSIISQSKSQTIITSTDDTDKITDWYKDTITQVGFNIKNFVKTKANGDVDNVLKANSTSDNSSVEVRIKQNQGESLVTITILLSI